MRPIARLPLVHAAVSCVGWTAVLLCVDGLWRLPAAASVFLACFTVFHDAGHGSYGLPRRINEALLVVVGTPLLFSTTAQRQLHLRHHARPMARDDIEGLGARRSLWGALKVGPVVCGRMHVDGARGVPPQLRRKVAAEHARSAIVITLALADPTGPFGAMVFVALALQLTISVWASHIPHHPPAWFLRLGARCAWLKTPVFLSALHHERHHATPKVPALFLT